MKRLITAMISFSILCCLSGCVLGGLNKDVVDEKFYCKIVDDNNIAIGDVKIYPNNGAVFFPVKIDNYTVSQIGFESGLGFGGNGYLSTYKTGETLITRFYCPYTIKEVLSAHLNIASLDLKIFYCGDIINLRAFDDSERGADIYVPAEKYELFKNELSKRFSGTLFKANVLYLLNYEENNYYYVDYYEYGEKISYIPPIPEREGYTFGGWYKESECINQWDFEKHTVQISEEMQEIKLYAKWVVE